MKTEQLQTFPRDLLEKTDAAKKRYFHDYTIAHPTMNGVRKSLLDAIEDAGPDTLIFVFGPAGVGKSTLCVSTYGKLTQRMAPQLELEPARIAAVHYSLRPPTPPAFFSWPDNFLGLLTAVEEPLPDRKVLPEELFSKDLHHLRNRSHSSSAALRRSYEKVLEWRRPVAVLLDEAQVLTKAPAARLLDQLDVIKSIASNSKIPHILFGTYALLPVRDLDGQESRRSVDLHFSRYTQSNTDRAKFTNAVRNLSLAMPFEEAPDFDQHIDLLLEKSAGCIGVLKPWLEKAYAEALRTKSTTVTIEHIEKNAHTKSQLTKIFTEIAEGEEYLQSSENNYEQALARLSANKSRTSASGDTEEKVAEAKKAKRKVGERLPERDRIGSSLETHDAPIRKAAS